jgi:hypothetical protein
MMTTAANGTAHAPWQRAPEPREAREPTDRSGSPLVVLAQQMHARGHAVHARSAPRHETGDPDLVRRAAEFLGQVLIPPGGRSRHAYIRLYETVGSLFVEVTQLAPGSYDETTGRLGGQRMIDSVGRWAAANHHVLSVRRGPRDRLRIAVMLRRRCLERTEELVPGTPGGGLAVEPWHAAPRGRRLLGSRVG